MTWRVTLLSLLLLGFSSLTLAAIDTYEFSSPERQQRFSSLTEELRCPKCQNQNIADSNSPIANDLRREIYRMLEEGQSDDEVVAFLVDRYGEFVLYKPRFTLKTLVLWGGPVLFLLIGLFVLFGLLTKNSKINAVTATREESEHRADALNDAERQRLNDLLNHK